MNNIIVIYKEIGKLPVLKKILNDSKTFENLLGGEIDYISYEDIIIVCKKERKRLNPNIYLNVVFGAIDSNIRGNILVIAKNNGTFSSLTKQQAVKYGLFLVEESFRYNKLNNTYIPNISTTQNTKTSKRCIYPSDRFDSTTNTDEISNDILKMILGIQTKILTFLKNYTQM